MQLDQVFVKGAEGGEVKPLGRFGDATFAESEEVAAKVIGSESFPGGIREELAKFRERVAIVLLWLIYSALFLGGSQPIVDAPFGLVVSATTIFILLRFGMLALVFTEFFILFFNFYPVTSDFSAWYAGSAAFAAALGAGLMLYGFKSSLAGQPLFKGSLVGD